MNFNANNSHLIHYFEKIKLGEIIAGKELYIELKKLVNDIKNNDKYIYNTEKSSLRIDFIENCIRLTKSPYYNKPMLLMLWQKAFIEAIYSFKHADKPNIERFKRILLLIARKNGKSETCSALGNSEFILGNEGSDLVCSSNDDRQASIVYDAIDLMRQLYDPFDLDTKRNQRFIRNKVTNTKIFKLSQRTDAKEGFNVDWSVLDEAHELKNNTIAKSIEQSQSLKDNPKLIIITTEGFVIDGFLDEELKKARAIIFGEDDSISAESYLPWLYTQDSEAEIFNNPKSWYKSNPSLGTIKKISYLEEQIDLAKKSKADRIFVLSKDFNMRQNGVESWLNIEDYGYDKTFNLEDFRGSYCLGHVDLAETTDLCCAKVLMIRPNDNTKYIHTMYFIPQSKLEDDKNDHEAEAKYEDWAKNGLITICEGNDIDLTIVADWFYELIREYDLTLYKCGYDQRFAKDWIKQMEYYGWTKQYGDLEMIQQNAQVLNNATLLVEADFKAQLINYNNNAVDRWCFKNACIKLNDLRQALIVKTDVKKKIDGAVTLVNLYEMYRRYRSDLKKLAGGENI